MDKQRCSLCGRLLPLTAFYKRKGSVTGHRNTCKQCNKKSEARRSATLRGHAAVVIAAARQRAKRRKLPFEIDLEWMLAKLETGRCEATGLPFVYTQRCGHDNRRMLAPSLDRKDCHRGYTKKNTQVVVYAYNACKCTGSDKLALAMCLAMAAKYLQAEADKVAAQVER